MRFVLLALLLTASRPAYANPAYPRLSEGTGNPLYVEALQIVTDHFRSAALRLDDLSTLKESGLQKAFCLSSIAQITIERPVPLRARPS